MPRDEKLFRSKFEKVRKQYSESLREKLAALESAFMTVHAKIETSQVNGGLSKLLQIAHKLAGSGASFGFP